MAATLAGGEKAMAVGSGSPVSDSKGKRRRRNNWKPYSRLTVEEKMELEEQESVKEEKRELSKEQLPQNRFGHIPKGTRVQDYRPDAPKNSTQFVIGEWTKFRCDSLTEGEDTLEFDENGTFAVDSDSSFCNSLAALVKDGDSKPSGDGTSGIKYRDDAETAVTVAAAAGAALGSALPSSSSSSSSSPSPSTTAGATSGGGDGDSAGAASSSPLITRPLAAQIQAPGPSAHTRAPASAGGRLSTTASRPGSEPSILPVGDTVGARHGETVARGPTATVCEQPVPPRPSAAGAAVRTGDGTGLPATGRAGGGHGTGGRRRKRGRSTGAAVDKATLRTHGGPAVAPAAASTAAAAAACTRGTLGAPLGAPVGGATISQQQQPQQRRRRRRQQQQQQQPLEGLLDAALVTSGDETSAAKRRRRRRLRSGATRGTLQGGAGSGTGAAMVATLPCSPGGRGHSPRAAAVLASVASGDASADPAAADAAAAVTAAAMTAAAVAPALAESRPPTHDTGAGAGAGGFAAVDRVDGTSDVMVTRAGGACQVVAALGAVGSSDPATGAFTSPPAAGLLAAASAGKRAKVVPGVDLGSGFHVGAMGGTSGPDGGGGGSRRNRRRRRRVKPVAPAGTVARGAAGTAPAHTLSAGAQASGATVGVSTPSLQERLAALEAENRSLREKVEKLSERGGAGGTG